MVANSNFIRPAEVDVLLGDASKARHTLGWRPAVTLEHMIAQMVDAEFSAPQGTPEALK